jgi:methyltransferase family protein
LSGPERGLRYRRAAAATGARLASRLHDYLEYVGVAHLPSQRDRARWGHGRPSHARLDSVLTSGAAAYADTIGAIAGHADELAKIRTDDPDPGEPHWTNPWIPGLDGAALYGLTRRLRPARYVEVGSGISTLFVHRARRDGATPTVITSVDPYPRAEVDAVCDLVVRRPLEQTDLSVFSDVRAGDMVFVDNSHHALLNSDVTTFFFDVLPELPAGVVVGIHDILLPDDYYPHWGEHYFSEQYVLAGMLLAGTAWFEPVLAAWWCGRHPERVPGLEPLWDRIGLPHRLRHGTAFWFRTTAAFPGP